MARKKKKRSGLRNFSNVNIKLNIPWNPRGQGNKSFFRIIEKNPELKEYLTKESFEKLYDTEFSEFKKPKEIPQTTDSFGDALSLIQSGNMSPEQIQAFLQSLLGQTTFGEITNFEFPDNSVGDNYVYAFGDGTPLFNPEFITNLQNQLDTLGIDLDDLNQRLSELQDENVLLQSGSDSLGLQNGELINQNASLTGENAALRAALAQQPTFGIDGVEDTGLPTVNFEGQTDDNTGLPTLIRLNCAMNNVTSKKVTIYKITPTENTGLGLNLSEGTVAFGSSNSGGTGNLIDVEIPAATNDILIGNTGSNREIDLTFEAESVYIFEVTGTNNAGVEDNESPKTLTKSAIFTTIDTDDEQLETLATNLSTAQTSLTQSQDRVIELEESLQEAQGSVNTLNSNITTLETQRNNAVNTLDGFSDNIVQKINSLKSALEQEEITDTTLTQVNALISSFNTFVPNINSNTPPTSPVTQISEFDRLGGDTEDNSNINPSEYPEWLGGDSIMEVDDDNILFDLDGVTSTPWFNIPELTYNSVPNQIEINQDNIQDKILVVVRPHRIKYIIGGLSYPYMFARSSDFTTSKFLSNKGMFSYDTGKLYDYTQGSDSWFNQTNKFPTDDGIVLPIFGKRPSLRLRVKTNPNGGGSTIYNTDIGRSENRATYKDGLLTGDTKYQAGNRNLMALASYDNYDGYGYDGVYMVNGGNSFKFELDKSIIPYRAAGITNVPIAGTHTYAIGLQFDFIVRQNSGNFIFKSRKVTGNFSFTKADLLEVQP